MVFDGSLSSKAGTPCRPRVEVLSLPGRVLVVAGRSRRSEFSACPTFALPWATSLGRRPLSRGFLAWVSGSAGLRSASMVLDLFICFWSSSFSSLSSTTSDASLAIMVACCLTRASHPCTHAFSVDTSAFCSASSRRNECTSSTGVSTGLPP